jgi:hypothetical protein
MALYLAWFARSALEGMHVEGTLTPEMKRLNHALRDGIYSGLIVLERASRGDAHAISAVRGTFATIAEDWRGHPQLLPSLAEPSRPG